MHPFRPGPAQIPATWYSEADDSGLNEYGRPAGTRTPGKRSLTDEPRGPAVLLDRGGSFGQVPYRREMEAFFGEDFGDVRASVGRADELGPFGAGAAAHGERVLFADASPPPSQVAHELTHVVQHRRHGAALAFDRGVSDPGDAAEREARDVAARYAEGASAGPIAAAPSASVQLDPGDAAAIAANQALGLSPDAVELVRRALGLSARGDFDAEVSLAAAERQRAAALPVTGILDEPTLGAIPFETQGTLGSRATAWYRAATAQPWASIPEAQRSATLARVVTTIHAPPDGATWGAGRGGPVVTPAFVRAATAWQIWQRSGLTPDGQLGASSFVRIGISVGGAPGRSAAINVDNLDRGDRDPRLAELLAEDTFASRCLAMLTRDGRDARLGELRGEEGPVLGLGSVSGGFGPRQFLARMFEVAPDVVRRAFFGDAGGDRTLDDVYAALGLGASASGDRLSSIATSAGYDQFVALLRTPEAVRVQMDLFVSSRIAGAESAASTLVGGTGPTTGTVALLALLEGLDAASVARRVPDGDEAAVQTQLALDYVAPELAEYAPPVAAVLRAYVTELVTNAVSGQAQPEFGDFVAAAEPGAGATLPFEHDGGGRAVAPPRARRVADVVARFRDAWTRPYAGAQAALALPAAGAPTSSAVSEEGEFPSIITPRTAVISAIDRNRRREPTFNPEWVAAMQEAIGAARTGRFTEGTVQFIAQFQRTASVGVPARDRGVLTDATMTALRARHPNLSTIPADLGAAPLEAGANPLVTAAQTTERPIHEREYDRFQAVPTQRVAVLPLTWDELMSQMGTYDFLGLRIAGHRLLASHLHAAETYLRMRFPGRSDAEIAREVGLNTNADVSPGRTQLRAETDSTSYHNFGLAVDLSATANPWVGGNETDPDEANHHTSQAIWLACWLTGRAEPVHPADSDARAERQTTDELWEHFRATSQALEQYFGLRGNQAGVQALLPNLAREPAALPAEIALPAAEIERLRHADAAAWVQRIEVDWNQTHGAGSTNWGRSSTRGFMNHRLELVRALRDAGGMSWGACDLGRGSSGDFMHFDVRPAGFERLRNIIRPLI